MRADHLAYEIVKDKNDDLIPFFVAATVGTTSTTAIDPVTEVGWVASNFDAWTHVDAAFAGSAALCPEMRFLNEGLETADSYVFNPHKWMLTNFDCSAFYVADRASLNEALSITPEYLRNPASESGAVVDYRDWQVPLGRRFRALKLWFVIRHYGLEGLRAHIRRHIAWAAELTEWVEADARFELAAPTVGQPGVLSPHRWQQGHQSGPGRGQPIRPGLSHLDHSRRPAHPPGGHRQSPNRAPSRARALESHPIGCLISPTPW